MRGHQYAGYGHRQHGGMMLLRGRKPGTKMLNQCIDPGEPFNAGAGRVIFELEVLGEE